jgi:hypothetical protein
MILIEMPLGRMTFTILHQIDRAELYFV